MANHEELYSLIIRTVGTADAEKLSKALQAAGMSADQASAAVERLNKKPIKTDAGGDKYADQLKRIEKQSDAARRAIEGVTPQMARLQREMKWTEGVFLGGGPNAQAAEKLLADQQRQYEVLASKMQPVSSEYERQQAEADRLLNTYIPMRATTRRLSDDQQQLAEMMRTGRISADEYASAMQALEADQKAVAAGGVSARASAYQWQNLMYQVNDVVSGLAMGQRPMQILAQQGGQLVQIGMQMNSPFKAIFSPTGFLVAGAAAGAAGLAMVIARAITLQGELRKLNATALAYNNMSISAPNLQRMAMDISQGSSFARSQAIAALKDLQTVQGLPLSVRMQIAGTSGVFADATGGDLTAAMQKLSSSFAKGYEGVKALDDEYNFLTASQRDQVRSLFDQRDAAKAWAVVLDALKKQMKASADEGMTPLTESLKNLNNEVSNFINAIATNPNTKALIDAAARLTKGGADLISGTDSRERFVVTGALGYGAAGALAGGAAGTAVFGVGAVPGAIVGGAGGFYFGKEYSEWLQGSKARGGTPSASGVMPRGVLYDQNYDAADETRLADFNRKIAQDITKDYEKRQRAINALTPAAKDLAEVEAEAISRYQDWGQQQAYIDGEMAQRAAQRNVAVQTAIYADNLQSEASRAVAAAFADSEQAGYRAQLMESARVSSLTKSTALSLEYAAAVAKQRTETEAFILSKGKELAAFERTSGYARTVANAALSGPAAKSAAADEAAIRGVYDPQILSAQDDAQRAALMAQMSAAVRNAATTRGISNLDSTNTSIQAQEQELRLIQQKIGLVGKSTEVQNEELSILNAKIEMQRLWGDNLPAEAEAYIENARAIARMNAELSRQQAALQEIANFGDRAFDHIGSAMTEMAMKGEDAWTSLGNVGRAVLSELYQEMVKLAIMNPLKNALGLSGGAALPTLATAFSSMFGGGSTMTASYQPGYGAVYASGGPVYGPGGPTDDAITARLSNGEFVVNAESAKRFRPMLDAINDNRIPAFATGGIVSASSASGGGAAFSGGLNVNIINNAGADIAVGQSQNSAGGIDLEVMVDRSVAKSISQRGSASNKALRRNFGATETLAKR